MKVATNFIIVSQAMDYATVSMDIVDQNSGKILGLFNHLDQFLRGQKKKTKSSEGLDLQKVGKLKQAGK